MVSILKLYFQDIENPTFIIKINIIQVILGMYTVVTCRELFIFLCV